MERRQKRANINNDHILKHYSGSSFSDLPKDVTQNILCRLTIRRIFLCKSVCKTWRDLILEHEFAKLKCHQLKLGMLDYTYSNSGCVTNVKVKLDPLFELGSSHDQYNVRIPGTEHFIVNSCNGLLCLSDRTDFPRVVICNPITKEFINLPEVEKTGLCLSSSYGFGFSQIANRYKVVRIVARKRIVKKGVWLDKSTAEVHVVGMESWRKISSKPQYFMHGNPTYLSGFLYWSCCFVPLCLISFDIENECFGLDSGPQVDQPDAHGWETVGVLGGELCLSVIKDFGTLHVWARKDFDVEKVWSKVISIDMSPHGKPIQFSLEPLKYLSDGSLLMLYSPGSLLVHIDTTKHTCRFLRIHRKKSKVEAVVAQVPSLVPLKHSLFEHNVQVLSLGSRAKVTQACLESRSRLSSLLRKPIIFI